LLLTILCRKNKRRPRKREGKISWWKLRKPKVKELLEKLSEKLDEIYTEEGLQWAETYPMVMKTAKEILGESVTGKYLEKESWW